MELLTKISVEAHGKLVPGDDALPTPHAAILRSFPGTLMMLKTADVTKKINASSSTYEYVYCFPHNLQKHLGAPPGHPKPHKPDVSGQPMVDNAEDVPARYKEPTPSQSSHTDGNLDMDYKKPGWCSLIIPVSPVVHLRYWQYSHDLAEALHDARSVLLYPILYDQLYAQQVMSLHGR